MKRGPTHGERPPAAPEGGAGAGRRALGWSRQRDEREYSFVDATSFMRMESLKIREALAFDGDFSAAGFIALRRA